MISPEEALGISEKATEETLQSIDRTLKRIADILEQKYTITPLQQIKESFEAALHQQVQ